MLAQLEQTASSLDLIEYKISFYKQGIGVDMNTRTLGTLEVSEIGLGCMGDVGLLRLRR